MIEAKLRELAEAMVADYLPEVTIILESEWEDVECALEHCKHPEGMICFACKRMYIPENYWRATANIEKLASEPNKLSRFSQLLKQIRSILDLKQNLVATNALLKEVSLEKEKMS